MSDLLARLAQRPPKPRMPQAATTNEWGRYQGRVAKRAEFDRDLALDALADLRAAIMETRGPDAHAAVEAADAILRELRGATLGEGAGHAD